MEYIYSIERAKMEKEYEKFAEEYKVAYEAELKEGKKPKTDLKEALSEIYESYKESLNSERRYITHTVSYHEKHFKDDNKSSEEHTSLIKHNLESFTTEESEIWEWGRYSWTDDIDNPQLYQGIKSLSQMDIEVLTLKIIDNKSQVEIAAVCGVSNAAISKRMKRIKEKLKDFCQRG